VVYLNREKKFVGIKVPLESRVLDGFKEAMLPTDINDVFPDPNKPEEPEEPPETPELPPFPGPGGTVITSAVSD